VLSLLLAGKGLDHTHIQGIRIGAGRLVVDTMKWR
jgi:hypothetical protein